MKVSTTCDDPRAERKVSLLSLTVQSQLYPVTRNKHPITVVVYLEYQGCSIHGALYKCCTPSGAHQLLLLLQYMLLLLLKVIYLFRKCDLTELWNKMWRRVHRLVSEQQPYSKLPSCVTPWTRPSCPSNNRSSCTVVIDILYLMYFKV